MPALSEPLVHWDWLVLYLLCHELALSQIITRVLVHRNLLGGLSGLVHLLLLKEFAPATIDSSGLWSLGELLLLRHGSISIGLILSVMLKIESVSILLGHTGLLRDIVELSIEQHLE